MAGVDNLDVQEKAKSMDELNEQGFWDGLAYKRTHPLPFVYFKRPIDMKPYEVGFLTGYLVAAVEGRIARGENQTGLDNMVALGPTCPDDSVGCT